MEKDRFNQNKSEKSKNNNMYNILHKKTIRNLIFEKSISSLNTLSFVL